MARAFPGTPSSEMIPPFSFIKRESGLTGSPHFSHSRQPLDPPFCARIPPGSPADPHLDPFISCTVGTPWIPRFVTSSTLDPQRTPIWIPLRQAEIVCAKADLRRPMRFDAWCPRCTQKPLPWLRSCYAGTVRGTPVSVQGSVGRTAAHVACIFICTGISGRRLHWHEPSV